MPTKATSNKQRLIDFLCELLSGNGIETEKASGDADKLIVRTALQKAESSHTVVVGEDTDLLILLLYHLEHHHWPLYLGNSRSGTNQAKFWDIQKVQDEIGSHISQQLLFVHAISGCDTTSAVYGLGKAAFLKKAMKSASFREEAKKFRTPHSTKDTIEPAGEKVLVEVYGGRESDTLNK